MTYEVFIVLVDDRHTDPEPVHVVRTKERAIELARAEVQRLRHEHYEPYEHDPPPEGWLFHATYCDEGDKVWVVRREIES